MRAAIEDMKGSLAGSVAELAVCWPDGRLAADPCVGYQFSQCLVAWEGLRALDAMAMNRTASSAGLRGARPAIWGHSDGEYRHVSVLPLSSQA